MKTHLLETQIPLSQSRLWQAQRHYFTEEGIHAWQQVPFFVTSNPFIADRYARLIAAYLQDARLNPEEPVYILELGTGSGQFSYYCHLALQKYLQDPRLAQLKICYVMTDFTSSNLAFWEEQAVFAPFFANHTLDYALFDIEAPEPLHLVKQNRTLKQLNNPLIVIGNYVFDSVRHALFTNQAGQVFRCLIDTQIAAEDYDPEKDQILSFKNIHFRYHSKAIDLAEEPPPLAALLSQYQAQLPNGSFSIPTSALDLLDFFKEYAPPGYLLLSSDKGFNQIQEMSAHPEDLVFHGSFSFEVNFHAIAEYLRSQRGCAHLQSYRDGIKTNLFLSSAAPTPRLDRAFYDLIEQFGPADYFRYHTLIKQQDPLDLNVALTQLRLSGPDPYVFSLFNLRLCEQLPQADRKLQDAFAALAPTLLQQIYPLPSSTDHAFNLGYFLHTLERYLDAIPCYEASIQRYGEHFDSCFNLGICYYYMDSNLSQHYFEKALPLAGAEQKPQVRSWLTKLKST